MKNKKSLFEQAAAIIFALSLVAGAGFPFFAACTHAYSGPIASYRVNTSAYIGMGLAVPLPGFILFTIASYGLKGAAEYFAILIGGLLGAAFRLVLAVALFASPIMAFICVVRNDYANAAFWLVSGIVLYVVGQAFKTVPTAEELQQKELKRERAHGVRGPGGKMARGGIQEAHEEGRPHVPVLRFRGRCPAGDHAQAIFRWARVRVCRAFGQRLGGRAWRLQKPWQEQDDLQVVPPRIHGEA